jgi:hypothetical protein
MPQLLRLRLRRTMQPDHEGSKRKGEKINSVFIFHYSERETLINPVHIHKHCCCEPTPLAHMEDVKAHGPMHELSLTKVFLDYIDVTNVLDV